MKTLLVLRPCSQNRVLNSVDFELIEPVIVCVKNDLIESSRQRNKLHKKVTHKLKGE